MADADQRRGAARQLPIQTVLVGDIQSAGRFIEDGVQRCGEQHAGKGHALLLAHRQYLCPVQLGIQATKPGGDIRKVDSFQQAQEFLIRYFLILLRIQQLAAQAAQQHVGLLRKEQHVPGCPAG